MQYFKKGQKVRIIRDSNSHHIPVGEIVTVKDSGSGLFTVEGYSTIVRCSDVEPVKKTGFAAFMEKLDKTG